MAVNGTAEPFVLFELAGTTYALPSRSVRQMEMVDTITPVPNTPGFVEGVVFARGEVVPALNLRRRFGLEKIPYDLKTRLVVVTDQGRTVGLLVDAAREFVTIPPAAIQPAPDAVTGLNGRYLESIAMLGERLILILNVAELLNVGAPVSTNA